jgi:hypothetical protein
LPEILRLRADGSGVAASGEVRVAGLVIPSP